METVHVKIADMAVAKNEGVLVTFGLGSCIGIALYDQNSKVGGLAHILLNDSSKFSRPSANTVNPAKFADTAVPHLIEKMLAAGARKNNIIAQLAGGASLFNFQNDSGNVGQKNIEAVRSILKEEKVKIESEDVGGNCGRTMRLFVDTGKVTITTVGKGAMKS